MRIYHIIDHAGFGTIHRLLYPLCDAYPCHRVLLRKSQEEFLDKKQIADIISDVDAIVVVHSTGNLDAVACRALSAFQLRPGRGFIFLHTSYEYQKIKGRGDMVDNLHKLQKEYKYIVLTPAKEVTMQYCKLGIMSVSVQLGIPGILLKPQVTVYRDYLSGYYGRYITTCSSEKEIYRYVKGIDRFIELSRKYMLEKECLIAGVELPYGSVESACFDEDDFLNILYHSKAYIQLSRFESYNLTAAWAKQFRVPVLVWGVEGTLSSMGQYALNTEIELEEKLRQVMGGSYSEKLIEDCYRDSIRRETIETFHRSLLEAVNVT